MRHDNYLPAHHNLHNPYYGILQAECTDGLRHLTQTSFSLRSLLTPCRILVKETHSPSEAPSFHHLSLQRCKVFLISDNKLFKISHFNLICKFNYCITYTCQTNQFFLVQILGSYGSILSAKYTILSVLTVMSNCYWIELQSWRRLSNTVFLSSIKALQREKTVWNLKIFWTIF